MKKELYIYLYDHNTLVGKLYYDFENNKELFSFEYDESFIHSEYKNIVLDPELPLYSGRIYPSNNNVFGFLNDVMPDRWGRKLIDKKERVLALQENRNIKANYNFDYLVGVSDITRMGAIRIAERQNGPFINVDNNPIPPWVFINKLEQASLKLEEDDFDEYAFNSLLSPGSSLGGARPKANVYDNDGNIWIAKFPSKNDDYDVGAYEMVIHDLMMLCDIKVPEAKLAKYSQYGSTFITKRFDRSLDQRIHYASIMTLLGSSDMEDNHSYMEIAELLREISGNPTNDLKELYKRIIFNYIVNNIDDHLRNHAMLLENKKWVLSPAFDVNTSLNGSTHSLKLSDELEYSLENIKKIGRYFKEIEADKTVNKIKEIIFDNLENVCKKYGLSRADYLNMEKSFKKD